MSRERAFSYAAEMIVTTDMHARKKLMFERADALVAFPGGVGTLEELVEQLTWSQLGQHRKPILVANIVGFWDPLLALLDHMRATAFIRETTPVNVLVADAVEQILPMLQAAADPVEAQDLHAGMSAVERISFQVMESSRAWNEASMMLGETPTVVQRAPVSSALSIKTRVMASVPPSRMR
eukprot:gene15328-18730_t